MLKIAALAVGVLFSTGPGSGASAMAPFRDAFFTLIVLHEATDREASDDKLRCRDEHIRLFLSCFLLPRYSPDRACSDNTNSPMLDDNQNLALRGDRPL
jgi:hypothetical protein